jgi:hypothetical protein
VTAGAAAVRYSACSRFLLPSLREGTVIDAPPIERYLVRLRLAAPVRFHFLHGAVLRGLVSRALGEHELPEGVIPTACESGGVRFEAGEAYHLGLTFVGEDRAAAAPLLTGLQRTGRASRGTDGAETLVVALAKQKVEPDGVAPLRAWLAGVPLDRIRQLVADPVAGRRRPRVRVRSVQCQCR